MSLSCTCWILCSESVNCSKYHGKLLTAGNTLKLAGFDNYISLCQRLACCWLQLFVILIVFVSINIYHPVNKHIVENQSFVEDFHLKNNCSMFVHLEAGSSGPPKKTRASALAQLRQLQAEKHQCHAHRNWWRQRMFQVACGSTQLDLLKWNGELAMNQWITAAIQKGHEAPK